LRDFFFAHNSPSSHRAKRLLSIFSGLDKISPNGFVPSFNRWIIRKGETPSGNGTCSARGLAKIAACIINGGKLENVRILSEETVEALHAKISRAPDVGIQNMVTEFSQGGVNLYRFVL
jgi:hypothetical protein